MKLPEASQPETSPPSQNPETAAPAELPSRPWVLTPSHLLEFLYCPRFTYFEFVMGVPEHEEKRFKVLKGREVHELRKHINPAYLRKRLGVVHREIDVQLADAHLHLSARVDEVLTLRDGTLAPFDYKYAEYKHRTFRNHRIQLALYGLLLKKLRNREVRTGFICYTRSRYRVVAVPLDNHTYAEAQTHLRNCRHLILTGYFPPPTESIKRCEDCCYANLCPKI